MLHNIITSSFLSKINQAIKSGSSEIKISIVEFRSTKQNCYKTMSNFKIYYIKILQY